MTGNFILASQSGSRQQILKSAGISYTALPAHLDEEKIKDQMMAENASPKAIAQRLADEKALFISKNYQDHYVLGADQILLADDRIFSKARDVSEARENLKFLRGRSHQLISALSLVHQGQVIWQDVHIPELIMRDFSDDFLDQYLTRNGGQILASVGCYFLEGEGIQLFSEIKGDFFAILGLPLINLMEKLRELNILQT